MIPGPTFSRAKEKMSRGRGLERELVLGMEQGVGLGDSFFEC